MHALSDMWSRGKEYLNGNAGQMDQVRAQVSAALQEAQVLSTVALVVSVVVDIFAFMAGGFLGTLVLIPALVVTLFSYDTMVACKKGIPMAQRPSNFDIKADNQLQMIQNISRKWMPMFDDTLVLGMIAAVLLSNIENEARQKH